MLEALLTVNTEKILLFINAREQAYATEIARFYKTNLYGIQKQLDKLEVGGVLVSRKAGRTRLYSFSPRCPYRKELEALLAKVMKFCPDDLKEKLLMNRRRPRRRGKPL